MASKKVTALVEAREEVLNICKKYDMNVLECYASFTKDNNWNIYIKTDCEDEETFDKVYTRCGFLNEERCIKDLSVSLDELL